MCSVIEGDHIILRRDDKLTVCLAKKKRKVFVDRLKFGLDAIIGELYGSVFQVESGELVKVKRPQHEDISVDAERGDDNRELLDRESNQKLTSDHIIKMKEEGIKGESIIEHLVENSATFKSKTEYSQEKYLKKKKKRHIPMYTVLKPNTRLLCELHLASAAKKICNLRMDTLAMMLAYGNVQAGLTLAVVENCQGLVLGAVMERMMGYGKVVHLFPGTQPTRPILEAYNFSPEVLKSLYSYPLPLVNELYKDNPMPSQSEDLQKGEQLIPPDDPKDSKDVPAMDVDSLVEEQKCDRDDPALSSDLTQDQKRKRVERKEQRRISLEGPQRIFKSKKLDGLIVATNYDPTPIVYQLCPFVQPSRPIVIYSQYLEPLMDCHVKLREKNDRNLKGVNYRLTDSWLREYQVLPDRTHPLVRMNSTSGYLLTFTTVASD